MKYILIIISMIATVFTLNSVPLKSHADSGKKIMGQVGFDELRIENIIIGLEPYERVKTQDLLIDMKVTYDLNEVTEVDDLESTIDYVKLGELASKIAEEGHYYFIDVLGLDILKQVFLTFPEAEEAYIKIQKPAALPSAKSGGLIEISQTRNQVIHPKANHKTLGEIGFDRHFVHTVIGDLDIERENKQDLLVDARVTLDLKGLSQTGDLKSTVSYVEMAKIFDEVAKKGEYQMIETLAVMYVKELKKLYPHIVDACVQIRKPGTLPNYPFKTDAVTQVCL